jgi:hypothetical protein
MTSSVSQISAHNVLEPRVEVSCRDVLFEPWSLGDAIIAAAIGREDSGRFALLCDHRWIELIRAGLPGDSMLQVIGVHLPYTMRSAQNKYSLPSSLRTPSTSFGIGTAFNIRGDIRDYRAARKMFPNAKVRQSGLFSFLARRSAAVDLPAKLGLIQVRNRYKAWAELTGVSFDTVEQRYAIKVDRPRGGIIIHTGAQWGSKRYPHLYKLVSQFENLD